MFIKKFADINEDDLTQLIANGVPEGITIEYKRDLPGESDSDKKEFLADVSSFANTSGGYIIYGLDEEAGLPREIAPLVVEDADAYVRKVDEMIRMSIQPRMEATHRFVDVAGGKVLLLKVERSTLRPHRVVFKSHDKFYMRGAAGKYSMDTVQLRDAFLHGESLAQKIRVFHSDRIASLCADETPVPLASKSMLCLHIIPASAFETSQRLTPATHLNDAKLEPICSSGWSPRINLDGVLVTTGSRRGDGAYAYTQLYRSGIIEAVAAGILGDNPRDDGVVYIPSLLYEQEVRKAFPRYMSFLQEAGVQPPFYVFLTLTGVKGKQLGISSSWMSFGETYPVDRDVLSLPECYVENYDTDVDTIFRPMFDVVWNCCGYARSRNYNNEGVWQPQS